MDFKEPKLPTPNETDLRNISGLIPSSADTPTGTPRAFWQQLRIVSGALYFYDTIANAWYSTAAAVTSFLGLSDTPNSYTGQANKLVSVKSDESGLEFVSIAGGVVPLFATTNATPTVYGLFNVTTSCVVDVSILAKRTGGSSGAAGDMAAYIRRVAISDDGAGSFAFVGSVQDGLTSESQPGWDATLILAGSTLQVQYNGSTNNNVDWSAVVNLHA